MREINYQQKANRNSLMKKIFIEKSFNLIIMNLRVIKIID